MLDTLTVARPDDARRRRELEIPVRDDLLSQEDVGKYVRDVDDAITFFLEELSRNEQRLGVALWIVRQEKLYTVLQIDTFEAYLASKGMSKSNGYRYVEQAEIYLLPENPPATPREVAAMGLVKSLVIANDVKGKTAEEAAEYVADAIELSAGDLRTRLEERRGIEPDSMTQLLHSIRSQIGTYALRLRLDSEQPEALLSELSNDALRWRDQITRLRESA